MNHPMQPPTWIERGPDGRSYYVKRKLVLRPWCQKVVEGINEIRSKNPFFNNPPVNAPSTSTPQPAPVPDKILQSRTSTARPQPSSKHKPQAQPNMAERRKDSTQSSITPQPQSLSQPPFLHWPQHYNPPQAFPPSFQPYLTSASDAQNQQNAALQLARYAAPHPRMYPYVPPDTLNIPSMGGYPGHTPNTNQTSLPHIPTSVASGHTYPGLEPVATNGRPMNADSMEHKCSVCGRRRSPRYHWKHPVIPGQPPKPSVCRKCRKQATDSEHESTDSYQEEDCRTLSSNRRRSRGRTSRPQSKARSSSRSAHQRVDFDYYAGAEQDESSTESDKPVRARSRRRKSRPRRATSSSLEIVRHVHQPRPQDRRRKIVYVEEQGDQRSSSDDADEIEYHYLSDAPRSRIVRSRAEIPTARLLPRYRLDSEYQPPIIIERREYYDGPSSDCHHRRFPPSRANSLHPYRQSRSASRQPTHSYEQYKYEHDGPFADVSRVLSQGQIKNIGRSRSRSRASIDEGAESRLLEPHVLPAPNPPMSHRRRSSSLVYMGASRDRRIENTTRDHDEHPRSSSRRRRRTDTDGANVGEKLTSADDYDWYDKDGMKVRVREI